MDALAKKPTGVLLPRTHHRQPTQSHGRYLLFSRKAKDLLRQLLCRKDKRLGTGAGGVADIKSHPFFKGIPWDTIRDEAPPYVPDITNAADTSNFPDVDVSLIN